MGIDVHEVILIENHGIQQAMVTPGIILVKGEVTLNP
jgi:hypothetical protein